MTRARARSLWLAGPALVAACSSSPSAQAATTAPSTVIRPLRRRRSADDRGDTSTDPASAPATTTSRRRHLVPVDPSLLIPIAVGNKPFPAAGDELATEHHGYTGDPNATLQAWLITPMAVPSGPDVRLLGFARTVGINSTTATFLTGPIDPEAVLTTIAAALAPTSTYNLTPSTRTEGTATIHGFDAQPTTVQGDPPGWSVEASAVDQLGIVRITRNDYTFDKVVPTFADLPPQLAATGRQPRRNRGDHRRCAVEHQLRVRRRLARRFAGTPHPPHLRHRQRLPHGHHQPQQAADQRMGHRASSPTP